MRTCPHCATSYSDDHEFCAKDGFRLSPPAEPVRAGGDKGLTDALGPPRSAPEAAPPPDEELKPPEIGELVASRYRVMERLGEGGFGVVYRCDDQKFAHSVALKFFVARSNFSDANLAMLQQRFTAEAAALRRVEHRHIVNVLDAGVHRGCPWYAMQFVQGQTLAHYAKARGPALPPDEVRTIGAQLGSALGAIHARSLVHLDVKPANILVRKEDGKPFVTLIDLGVAEVADVSGSISTLLRPLEERAGGTPVYMSPEQYLYDPKQRLTFAADVYAAGVVLFQALTGSLPKHPPSHGTPEAWRTFFDAPAPAVRSVRADVPEALARVIDRCLLRNPADRYADGTALQRALEQDAPVAPTVPADAGGARTQGARRWRMPLAALAVAAAAFAVWRLNAKDDVEPRPVPHGESGSPAGAPDAAAPVHREERTARVPAGAKTAGPAAHPQTGQLDLQIEPKEGSLTLNGAGTAAGLSEKLKPGEYAVAGELEGYERQEKKFLVSAGRITPAHLRLSKLSCEIACEGNLLKLANPARQYTIRLAPGTTRGRKAEFNLFVRRPGSDGKLWDLTTTGPGAEATVPGGAQIYQCSKDRGAGGGCSGGCVAASPSASLTVDDAAAVLLVTCR